MNMSMYRKTYLKYVNIPILVSFIIPFLSLLVLFDFLGMHGGLLFISALFGGSLVSTHVRRKLDINPTTLFVSEVLGLVITYIIIIILQKFGITINILLFGFY